MVEGGEWRMGGSWLRLEAREFKDSGIESKLAAAASRLVQAQALTPPLFLGSQELEIESIRKMLARAAEHEAQ